MFGIGQLGKPAGHPSTSPQPNPFSSTAQENEPIHRLCPSPTKRKTPRPAAKPA